MADHTDPQKQSTFAGDMEETRKRMQQNGRAGEYDDGLVEVRKENPEKWLLSWNQTGKVEEIKCLTSIDIMFYCLSPVSQWTSVYQTGQLRGCDQQISDVSTCFRLKGEAYRNPEKAQRMLDERFKTDHKPHVWEFRKQPPEQYR